MNTKLITGGEGLVAQHNQWTHLAGSRHAIGLFLWGKYMALFILTLTYAIALAFKGICKRSPQ